MKYIDASHLKVEIEKHIKEVKDAAERFKPNFGFFDAKLSGIYDVMAIIDSLQQEQSEVDLEKDIEQVVEKYNSLANGIKVMKPSGVEKIARHFYELGKNSK